ncbi:hypothetical protein [Sphingobacterium sp.]|uniref:hypothetical protein n=1 Tax=Sphingobacterium sp. TaxID=341027 RepID=UPI0028974199|nr:hypothetical protein [Sphingobacterium sp.]
MVHFFNSLVILSIMAVIAICTNIPSAEGQFSVEELRSPDIFQENIIMADDLLDGQERYKNDYGFESNRADVGNTPDSFNFSKEFPNKEEDVHFSFDLMREVLIFARK